MPRHFGVPEHRRITRPRFALTKGQTVLLVCAIVLGALALLGNWARHSIVALILLFSIVGSLLVTTVIHRLMVGLDLG